MTTELDGFALEDAPLPGMDTPADTTGGIGACEAAARRTIAGMADRLTESDAVMCQALVTAARQIDRAAGGRQAKDYAVANLLAQLRETFTVLRGEDEGGDDIDPFDQLAIDLARRAHARGPTDRMAE